MPKLYVDYHDDPSTSVIEYTEATPAEIAEGFLNGVVEPANMYRKGRMYYAIPIEHYGKATDSSSEKNPLEGNYGVVRNNFYQVSIGTFKSLGHGIDDVDWYDVVYKGSAFSQEHNASVNGGSDKFSF